MWGPVERVEMILANQQNPMTLRDLLEALNKVPLSQFGDYQIEIVTLDDEQLISFVEIDNSKIRIHSDQQEG